LLYGLQLVVERISKVDEGFSGKLIVDIADALAKLAVYAPEPVEQFLTSLAGETEVISTIRRRVQASERTGAVSDIISSGIQYIVRDKVVWNDDQFLMNQLIWCMGKVPECDSIEDWLALVTKLLVNLLYLPDRQSVFDYPDLLSAKNAIQTS
jgi:hypothetical protein